MNFGSVPITVMRYEAMNTWIVYDWVLTPRFIRMTRRTLALPYLATSRRGAGVPCGPA
ncbi:hypothetical protein AHiyo8_64160 [Arthrobacter sp. Hiyo8]|nr:hypothetical protein AHiyo8_64160 [Arthrobacter sp. Hiyo8]